MFAFNINMGNATYLIEITLGNTIIQRLSISEVFAVAKVQELVMQLAKEDRPFKVKCSTTAYTSEGKPIEECLIYKNNAYVKSEEEAE